jgi:hypothetical protein
MSNIPDAVVYPGVTTSDNSFYVRYCVLNPGAIRGSIQDTFSHPCGNLVDMPVESLWYAVDAVV